MNTEERDKYLRNMPVCRICNREVPKEEKILAKSVVELLKHPTYADPQITRYYIVCPECAEKGLYI